jgi:hypothetical protein
MNEIITYLTERGIVCGELGAESLADFELVRVVLVGPLEAESTLVVAVVVVAVVAVVVVVGRGDADGTTAFFVVARFPLSLSSVGDALVASDLDEGFSLQKKKIIKCMYVCICVRIEERDKMKQKIILISYFASDRTRGGGIASLS